MSWFRLLSPGWIKTRFFLISKYFFTCPDLFPLQNQLYPSLQSNYFGHFFVAQVLVVRVFFTFNYIVLFSTALWKFLFFIRNNFLYANFPFHSLWSKERQLPAMTSLKQLTLPLTIAGAGFVWGEQNKYLYGKFSVFSNDWLSFICVN